MRERQRQRERERERESRVERREESRVTPSRWDDSVPVDPGRGPDGEEGEGRTPPSVTRSSVGVDSVSRAGLPEVCGLSNTRSDVINAS
jgi:hypothetical protein